MDYNSLTDLKYFTFDIGTTLMNNGQTLYTDGTYATFNLASQFNHLTNINLMIRTEYRKAKENQKQVMAFVFGGGTSSSIVIPSYYDFVIFSPNYACDGVANVMSNVTQSTGTPTITTPLDYFGVGLYDYNQWLNRYNEYTAVTYEFSLDSGDMAVYDFTSVYNDTLHYTQDGDGIHLHYLNVDSTNGASFNLGVGSPYSSIREQGYTAGYNAGYLDGNNTGYEQGLNDGRSQSMDRTTLSAFDYVGSAFNAVAGIMSLEVLPHVTLGLCFSIPLCLVLCMTVFRLIKK